MFIVPKFFSNETETVFINLIILRRQHMSRKSNKIIRLSAEISGVLYPRRRVKSDNVLPKAKNEIT